MTEIISMEWDVYPIVPGACQDILVREGMNFKMISVLLLVETVSFLCLKPVMTGIRIH